MSGDKSDSAQVLDQLPLPILLPIMLEYIKRARMREMERLERQKQREQKSRVLKRVIPKASTREHRERVVKRKVSKLSLLERISKFFGLIPPILTGALAIYHFFAPAPAPSIVVTPVYGKQTDSTDYLFNHKKLEKLFQYLEPLLLHLNNVIGNAVVALHSGEESQSFIKAGIIEHLVYLKQGYDTHSSMSVAAQLERKQMTERADVLIAVLKIA